MNKILASEEEMIIFKRILDIKEDMPLEICEAGQNILRTHLFTQYWFCKIALETL